MKKFIVLIILNQSVIGFCQPQFLNIEPNWSPDGKKIVFVSKRDGNNEVYLMNKDGSEINKLTNTNAKESDPSIAPDGTKILFLSERDGVSQIYVMNIDGSNPINITKTKNHEFSPCWSPKGDKIAFQSTRDETSQIYIMNVDGSNPQKVSDLDYNNSFPKWSSDGKKLICQSVKLPNDFKCSIIHLDNAKIEHINTDPNKRYISDCFSKDNKHVLYHSIEPISYTETSSNLYTYDIELKTSKQLVKNLKNLITAQFLNDPDSIILETKPNLYFYSTTIGKKKEVIKNAISPQYSPKEGIILFVSDNKRMDICTVRFDGSAFKILTK
jgi:Tol biopolymer transport system component